MCKFRFLVCLLVLFGFGFSSQPDACLFKKQHLVVSFDWHKEISRPNSIEFNRYYFFNRGISDFTFNDTIQMQGLQTDASKVTFGKIALESLGALGGGFLLAYPLVDMNKNDYQVGHAIGFAIGPAIGATLIGNKLMDPNGSFLKSIIGSTLSSAFVYLIWFCAHMPGPELPTNTGDKEFWFTIAAIGLPVMSATAGYNIGIPEMNQNSSYFERNHRFFNETVQLNQMRLKLSLISIEF